MTNPHASLLHELAEILRDYLDRISPLGPETLRLRGESHAGWADKQRRARTALDLLGRAATAMSANPDADPEAVAREVDRAPAVPREEAPLASTGPSDQARWDPIVLRLTEILGDLAYLGAAATGAGEVTAQIHEAAAHVARAAALALPRSKYGAPDSARSPAP